MGLESIWKVEPTAFADRTRCREDGVKGSPSFGPEPAQDGGWKEGLGCSRGQGSRRQTRPHGTRAP